MTCPSCGSDEMTEVVVGQDPMGNDLHAVVCANGDCDHVYREQDSAFDCLHVEVERDEIGCRWCCECGDYLGER